MEDSLVTDDTLAMLVGYYEAAEQATVDSRAEAEMHRDYRNGDQWTAAEIAALNEKFRLINEFEAQVSAAADELNFDAPFDPSGN